MRSASRTTAALITLAQSLAAHEAVTLEALSGRALGKGGFFAKLARGGDCRTATAERVLGWFMAVWPDDLPWPAGVSRPGQDVAVSGAYAPAREAGATPGLTEPDDAFLARLAHLPIWSSGRRPPWWDDIEVRAFLTRSHRQMSTLKAASKGAQLFGDRCPRKSAINEYWQRLDKVLGQPRHIPRPKTKEAA